MRLPPPRRTSRRWAAVVAGLVACSVWLSAGPGVAQTNVLLNPGFEAGTTANWGATSLTNTQTVNNTQGPIHGGAYAVYANGGTASGDQFLSQSVTVATGGSEYSVTGWVYRGTSTTAYIDRGLCLLDNTSRVNCAAMSTATVGAWTSMTATLAAVPAGTLTVRAYIAGAAGVTGTFWDDFSLSATVVTTTTAAPTTTTTVTSTSTTSTTASSTTVAPTTTTPPAVQAISIDGWEPDALPMLAGLVALSAGAVLGSSLVRRR